MSQLMPVPLTVFCYSKIQIGFTFLVPNYRDSPRQRAVKRVCVCVWLEKIYPDSLLQTHRNVKWQVRSPHISDGRPAAGSQRTYSLGSCATQRACYSLGWDRQTDGSRCRLIITIAMTMFMVLSFNIAVSLQQRIGIYLLQSHTHTHPFNGPLSMTTRVSRYQNGKTVKPIRILLKQETVSGSGSGISWAICKSASRSRQPRQHPTTLFLQAGCPSCRPANSVKVGCWWQMCVLQSWSFYCCTGVRYVTECNCIVCYFTLTTWSV